MREPFIQQLAGLVRRFQLRLRTVGRTRRHLGQTASAASQATAPAAASANCAALIDCLVVVRNAEFEVHGTSIH